MLRTWRALALATGIVALGTFGVQETANAASPNDIIDCNFTVTALGNGMQVWSPGFSTVVATLQTGQVFDLYNVTTTSGTTLYWNDSAFGHVGNWYPIRSTSIYMARVPNSCSNDTQ
jgi:hypothetical protein